MSYHDYLMSVNPIYRRLYGELNMEYPKPRKNESTESYGTRVHQYYSEKKNMCNIKQYGETMEVPFSHKGIIVDSGTVWYMDGRKIIIDQPVLHYHNTNGDVNTKYLSFQFQDDKSWNICTHKMFAGSAKTEEPLVERFITPDQIMRKSPCMEGASTLYKYLGIPYSEDPYLNGANLAASGKRSLAMNMQSLADGHLAMGRGRMPDNWLLFLANALNLVPNMRKGPDRATILRLLGIKE